MAARRMLTTLLLLLATAVPALLATRAPSDPTNAAECLATGGECLPYNASGESACPWWQRPFPSICGSGSDCCYTEYYNHSLRCGAHFGGDCAARTSCGRAPRYENAYCENPDDVCCIWLF